MDDPGLFLVFGLIVAIVVGAIAYVACKDDSLDDYNDIGGPSC